MLQFFSRLYHHETRIFPFFFLQVFGLYFMQSYIGIFYHALLHRNIMTLRQVLIQRLILYEVGKTFMASYHLLSAYWFLFLMYVCTWNISQVIENLLENFFPFLCYTFKKFRTVRYVYIFLNGMYCFVTSIQLPFIGSLSKKRWMIHVWRTKRKCEKGPSRENIRTIPRVEKDYLKPAYAASIGQELEDGLFDGNAFYVVKMR